MHPQSYDLKGLATSTFTNVLSETHLSATVLVLRGNIEKWKVMNTSISSIPTPIGNTNEKKRSASQADIPAFPIGIKKSNTVDDTAMLNNAGPQPAVDKTSSDKNDATTCLGISATDAENQLAANEAPSQTNPQEAQSDHNLSTSIACDTGLCGKHLTPERFWPAMTSWTTPLFRSLQRFLVVNPQWPMRRPYDIIAPCGGLLTETVGATVS